MSMASGSVTSSLIQTVLKVAKRTFARHRNSSQKKSFILSQDEFNSSLKELKSLIDGLRSHDLGLQHSKVLNWPREHPTSESPVTYIKILEDRDVSIGVFVVKSGCQIPLHNHPNMHGLLKVVYGTVDISSYSRWRPSATGHNLEIPQILRDKTHLIDQGFVFPTEKNLLKGVTDEHETLVLSPDDNNFHEIKTVGEDHAAFFDILAPPYHTESDMVDHVDDIRECHFFSEIPAALHLSNNNIHSEIHHQIQHRGRGKQDGSISWLRRIKSPDEYFCDTEPYLGPQFNCH